MPLVSPGVSHGVCWLPANNGPGASAADALEPAAEVAARTVVEGGVRVPGTGRIRFIVSMGTKCQGPSAVPRRERSEAASRGAGACRSCWPGWFTMWHLRSRRSRCAAARVGCAHKVRAQAVGPRTLQRPTIDQAFRARI